MIRSASLQDLPIIARIHSEGWHNAYGALLPKSILDATTPDSMLVKWQDWFVSDDIYVLLEDDEIVGFQHTCQPRDIQNPPSGFGELHHLYLSPFCIGKGSGHRLFAHAIEYLKSNGHTGMLLWTLDGNAPAQAFYERHGMSLDGARRDDPEWLGPDVYEVRYCLAFVD